MEAQLISPADVDRMHAERDSLTKSLEVVSAKLQALSQSVWESEMTAQKRMDSVEKYVQLFNGYSYKLGLNKVAGELHVDMQAAVMEDMLSIRLESQLKVGGWVRE